MIKKISPTTIDALLEKANENIDIVFEQLGIDIENVNFDISDDIRMPCPVHGGDNATAFSYNKNSKRWTCYTHDCHRNNNNIIGLVMLIKKLGFKDAFNWLASVVQFNDIQYNTIYDVDTIVYKQKVILKRKQRLQQRNHQMTPIPINKFRIVPSKYFQQFGITSDTLNHFYVGLYPKEPKMYNRVVVPILDDDARNVIGLTGRITFPLCDICQEYHDPNNGCSFDGNQYTTSAKWKHVGFNKELILYNIWNAKHHIASTNTVIITEGPKDVWWLYQNHIYNCLAVLGKNINQYQISKMIKYGVTKIILALDNDDAVLNSKNHLIERINKYFTVIDVVDKLPQGKDIAETPYDILKQEIIPLI